MKIAILLTTYNSEQYLHMLIDSLIQQTYREWELYVRDDQSTDTTPDILATYAQCDKRIHVIADEKKRGAKDGFMWLLRQISADYYMFCDHDDVWHPEKIEKSLHTMLQQKDNSLAPILVCCDLEITDQHLKTIHPSFWKFFHYEDTDFNDPYFHLFYNNIPGCSMMFNKRVRDLSLPYPSTILMHDAWIAAATLWNKGTIIPIKESMISYRQHEHNTIGAKEVPSLSNQMKRFSLLMKKTRTQHATSKALTRMRFIRFFFLKIKFMLLIHIRNHQ